MNSIQSQIGATWIDIYIQHATVRSWSRTIEAEIVEKAISTVRCAVRNGVCSAVSAVLSKLVSIGCDLRRSAISDIRAHI
jgi:hypothetical protein